jgi:hypothetical protein
MAPPPASTHASWQALHDFAQHHASQHGYALSINTTSKTRARIKLACVCYGAPKNTHKLTPATRVRRGRQSHKTGCRMWLEGRRQPDGSWLLRVGEPAHNHPGRARDEWAAQRRRTWGDHGGCMGVGGVAAREEMRVQAQQQQAQQQETQDQDQDQEEQGPPQRHEQHSLAQGGLVWQLVEREMGRKDAQNQGRDRGVGRTVAVLEARLPGIRIFKRDVYNIRAKIKRMRKSGEALGGGGVGNGDGEGRGDANEVDAAADVDADADADADADGDEDDHHMDDTTDATAEPSASQTCLLPAPADPAVPALDPLLVAPPRPIATRTPEQRELDQLRCENAELRELLRESQTENQRLKLRLDCMHRDHVLVEGHHQ